MHTDVRGSVEKSTENENKRFSLLKNISNFTMQMVEKVDVGGATCEAFIFDEIVFEEWLDRIALLNNEELKERRE